MIGWIVFWPNRKKAPDDLAFCGYAEIVQVMPYWILVKVLDRHDDEPEFHRMLALHDDALRYFPSLDEYKRWIAYWRRDDDDEEAPDNAWAAAHPAGQA